MPSIDMPLEQLRTYKPALSRQDDFSAFWQQGLEAVRRGPTNARFEPRSLPLRDIDVYAVRFDGADGATM